MTSNPVPIYRYGRKFYVSPEEYERRRADERLQRRKTSLESQHLPVSKSYQTTTKLPSTSLYNPVQRTTSNSYEYQCDILRTRHTPVNSLISTSNRRESDRLSAATLKHFDNYNDLSSIRSDVSKKKLSNSVRSRSIDKENQHRRSPVIPLASNTDTNPQRVSSAKIVQPIELQKSTQRSQIFSRRPMPAIVSDYGMSPIATFSMTPTDQTYTETNNSKFTSYFARMKQSSLNSPPKSFSTANSGTGSLIETSMHGHDHVYTVLGSSNRRSTNNSSPLITSLTSDDSKNEYYHHDTSSDLFSDDNSSLLSILNSQRNRNRRSECSDEIDDNYGRSRDTWTRSTFRSQSSDCFTEKKRVRFADTEGFELVIVSDQKQIQSSKNNRLLPRRQRTKVSKNIHEPSKPFYNAFYQVLTKTGENRLATDV